MLDYMVIKTVALSRIAKLPSEKRKPPIQAADYLPVLKQERAESAGVASSFGVAVSDPPLKTKGETNFDRILPIAYELLGYNPSRSDKIQDAHLVAAVMIAPYELLDTAVREDEHMLLQLLTQTMLLPSAVAVDYALQMKQNEPCYPMGRHIFQNTTCR